MTSATARSDDRPVDRPSEVCRADAPSCELGRGRSGVVYLRRDSTDRLLATKVFASRFLTKAIQLIFLGAPNPYIWSAEAIRCAYLRRKILTLLVPYWFAGRLSVADAVGFGWNSEHRAYELETEFCKGRPPLLYNPLRPTAEDEVAELASEVMTRLQQCLIEAGFDGLVWQAGKGNPVALNNFLLDGFEEDARWIWIDLESGVPAVAPANPLALFRFYLPRAIALRRPLFDDVDTRRLRTYLEADRTRLERRLGSDEFSRLLRLTSELATEQNAWKSLPRHHRGIRYALSQGTISKDEAAHFETRPFRWYVREIRRAGAGALRQTPRLVRRVTARLASFDAKALTGQITRFLASERYRARVARLYLVRRIAHWRRRGQLQRADAAQLRRRVVEAETGSYLTDFGVHLAIKPFTKLIGWTLLPLLFATGLIGEAALALGLLMMGAITRTIYTSVRTVQAQIRGQEKPWVALGTGAVPMVGSFAYAFQILYSSADGDDVARFILADGFAGIGRRVPIWGGQDTLTEHRFNRFSRLIIGRKRRRIEQQPDDIQVHSKITHDPGSPHDVGTANLDHDRSVA